jgi:branched-chain amino acid transport system permease protein
MPWERLVVVIVAFILVAVLFLLINRTKTGQAMVAVSQDRDAASLYGINIDRTSSIAMFLGCALAAAAGGLVGAITSISPTMGGFALIKGIAVIVIGGLGSITGAVLGGLIIGLLDGIIPAFLPTHMASIIGFAVIILILLTRPQGLLGHE